MRLIFPLYYPSGREDITVKPHLLYRQNWVHGSMHWPLVSYKYFKHYCALAQPAAVSKLLHVFTLCIWQQAMFLLMELNYRLWYHHVTNESYSSYDKSFIKKHCFILYSAQVWISQSLWKLRAGFYMCMNIVFVHTWLPRGVLIVEWVVLDY